MADRNPYEAPRIPADDQPIASRYFSVAGNLLAVAIGAVIGGIGGVALTVSVFRIHQELLPLLFLTLCLGSIIGGFSSKLLVALLFKAATVSSEEKTKLGIQRR